MPTARSNMAISNSGKYMCSHQQLHVLGLITVYLSQFLKARNALAGAMKSQKYAMIWKKYKFIFHHLVGPSLSETYSRNVNRGEIKKWIYAKSPQTTRNDTGLKCERKYKWVVMDTSESFTTSNPSRFMVNCPELLLPDAHLQKGNGKPEKLTE